MYFFSNQNDIIVRPKSVEHGYMTILEDDLKSASLIFDKIDSPRAIWGQSLVEIISGYVEKFPSYFGINNFYEIDLDFLIKNEKIEYVEQILGFVDALEDINIGTYKFTARVMLENKIYDAALIYLNKSKSAMYSDPELHFLFTKYYMINHDYERALSSIDSCLNVLPDYVPAKKIRQTIINFVQ